MFKRFSASIILATFLLGSLAPLSPTNGQNTVSGVVRGQVCDKRSKQPLHGARVIVENKAINRQRIAISQSDGWYTLPFMSQGSYVIKAEMDGYVPEETTMEPMLININTITQVDSRKHHWLVNIQLSKPTLRGQVLNNEGRGLGGSSVVVSSQRWGIRQTILTDQDGGYQIPDLPTGQYQLDAEWNGESAPSQQILLDRKEVLAPTIVFDVEETADNTEHPASEKSEIQKLCCWTIQPFGLNGLGANRSGQNPAGAATAQAASTQPADTERVALLVNTADATRRANFSANQIGALPLGGANYMRSFDELALLVAGVAPPPYTFGVRGPGVGIGIGTAGQFSVNGMRARSNNFSVDGSDNNDADVGVRRQGFVALVPQAIESVDGLSVVTLLWDAELGRNSGGQINAVSKYGVNQLHGQVYGFFNDSSLNARNFFDYNGGAAGGKTPFTRTQTGGILGGPIVRDRSHFFTSFEFIKVNALSEQHFATPTDAERRFVGLQSLGFANNDAFGVLNSGAVQPFNKTSPLGSNIFSLYPLPNYTAGPFGANTLTKILPASGKGVVTSFRLTQQFGEDHTLNARYNFTDDDRLLPSVNRGINSSLQSKTRSHNLSLIFDSALSLTQFNQARFSFGRTRLDFSGAQTSPSVDSNCPNTPKNSQFIFRQCSPARIILPQGQFPITSETGPIGELVIEPFSPVGVGVHFFPQARVSNTFQFADTFWWNLDKHSVKFGANVRRYQLNSRLDRLYRPQVVYAGGLLQLGDVAPNNANDLIFTPDQNVKPLPLTGLQLASLGVASAITQTITTTPPDSTVELRFNEYHLFINDKWQIKPRLTLDYGLRHEYSSVPHSADKRIERALTLESLPPQGNSRFNMQKRTDSFEAAVTAYRDILGGRNRIYDQDRNNFGPHFGLAWAPGKDGLTVLRAGYGIYYDAILGAVVTQSRNVFPREIPINVDPAFLKFDAFFLNNPEFLKIVTDAQGNFTNPISLLRPGACNQFNTCNQVGGDPADFVALIGELFLQNDTGGGLAFTLPEKRLRTPYSQQWHLTVERELFGDYFFSVAYVGNKGTKLTRLMTPNNGSIITPYISMARSLNGTDAVILNSEIGSLTFKRPTTQKLGAYQVYENSAASNYHALQIEARKRYHQRFQFTTAYTWSHAIDDVSDVFTIAGAPILPQKLDNFRLERADANFDVRHRVSASVLWDLPFYANNRRRLGRLLGGWQIAGIFQAQTGQPFTLTLPFDNNFDGNLSDRPGTGVGLIPITRHGRNRIQLAPGRVLNDYLNFSVAQGFTVPQNDKNKKVLNPGIGFVGRNSFRGDSFVNLDFSLSKHFRFTERRSLEFRTEFFNLFNRSNFGLPISVISAPGFGSAVETVNSARMIQFAIKFVF